MENMEKGFEIYRNDDVQIDFKVPGVLGEYVQEADEYYEKGDWFNYDMTVSCIEASCKQYLICGRITQYEFNRIWERYGCG